VQEQVVKLDVSVSNQISFAVFQG